jgi:hypothetical protein
MARDGAGPTDKDEMVSVFMEEATLEVEKQGVELDPSGRDRLHEVIEHGVGVMFTEGISAASQSVAERSLVSIVDTAANLARLAGGLIASSTFEFLITMQCPNWPFCSGHE